jgi:hypothetical protein
MPAGPAGAFMRGREASRRLSELLAADQHPADLRSSGTDLATAG